MFVEMLIKENVDEEVVEQLSSGNAFSIDKALDKLDEDWFTDDRKSKELVDFLFPELNDFNNVKLKIIKKLDGVSVLIDLLLDKTISRSLKAVIWRELNAPQLRNIIMIKGRDDPMADKARRMISEIDEDATVTVEGKDNLVKKKPTGDTII